MALARLQEEVADVSARTDGRRWRGRPLISYVYNQALPRGPHLSEGGAARPAQRGGPDAALLAAQTLAADCRVLDNLGLHQICARAASEAIQLLTSGAVGDGADGRTSAHGLGRLFGAASGQSQYLIDLQDDAVFGSFCQLARSHPLGVGAIRRICRAIATTPGLASVAGVVDAPPISGRADEIERHMWIRIAAGGSFSTNGLRSAGCWHVDNPRTPTLHPTGRLMVKLYSEACANHPHELQVRSAEACLAATLIVPPGGAVWMGDVARGSSIRARRANLFEHRGKTPGIPGGEEAATKGVEGVELAPLRIPVEVNSNGEQPPAPAAGLNTGGGPAPAAEMGLNTGGVPAPGAWTIELVLTCNVACFVTLEQRLRACGAELVRLLTGEDARDLTGEDACSMTGEDARSLTERAGGAAAAGSQRPPRTLADGAPLHADASHFVNHFALCGGREEARQRYLHSAAAHSSWSKQRPAAGDGGSPPQAQAAPAGPAELSRRETDVLVAQGEMLPGWDWWEEQVLPVAVAMPIPSS